MEKATKKVTEIEIEFQNGSKKKLSEIPIGNVTGLKLDGKEKDGKFTSFTLKRGFEKEEKDVYFEKRLFQNADMKDGVCYVLQLGLTLKACQTLDSDQTNVDYIATAKRIKVDGEKAGKGQADPEAVQKKSGDKLVASLRLQGKNEAADLIEAELKKVEEMKKKMKAHGFGK